MAISAIRTSRGLVQPFQQTPSGPLDLSVIDQIPVLQCYTRTLHVYRNGPGASKVIREALSKALVAYYPLAGRLKESARGMVQVDCSGEGAWFVEAAANCTLESVHFLDDYLSIPFDQLLPDGVPETGSSQPLVQMQVTQFACGGFVIGLSFCHTVCDGIGSAQFLNAVGELAKGLPLSVTPTWHRDFFPCQPTDIGSPISPPPLLPDYKLEHANIDISMEEINQIKQRFHESTGRTCSTFEIVAAIAWSSRTRAINLSPGTEEVKLVFFANCRKILDPPLPGGFYGNCFFPVTITATSESVAEVSVFGLIELIQEAKAELPAEFANYMKGGARLSDDVDPFRAPLGYGTLFISEWGRLGFNQVDFGWGLPAHVVPVQGSGIIPVGIVGWQPLPREGVRLMTWCVEEAQYRSFVHLMKQGNVLQEE